MSTEPMPPLLDGERAAFLQRRVAINVAARDAGNRPVVVRALGCRVSADLRQVTVFLSVPRSAAVIGHLRDNGAIAVVFTRPSTHQTVQLKATDAVVGPLAEGDRPLIAAYRDAFARDIAEIGFTESFARAVVSDDGEAVAVTFTPEAAFEQTPGPRAGMRLEQ